ncbi:MAG: hypothetical protein JKY45_08725 [Emcibacter sp.]|nr:hypothetical protein [Emcibacter sp.]
MNIIYLAPKEVTINTSHIKCYEQLLLWSIRTWVMGLIRKIETKDTLKQAYGQYKIPEASIALSHFMYCLSFGAKRALDIRCPISGSISPDEITIMNFITSAQRGNTPLAESILNDLCIEKYQMQTKYHAMTFTDIIQKKAKMTLTYLPLTEPQSLEQARGSGYSEGNITAFIPTATSPLADQIVSSIPREQ